MSADSEQEQGQPQEQPVSPVRFKCLICEACSFPIALHVSVPSLKRASLLPLMAPMFATPPA
eukprot:1195331-Prorocentrum_minimum.AAC.2